MGETYKEIKYGKLSGYKINCRKAELLDISVGPDTQKEMKDSYRYKLVTTALK